MSNFIFYDLGFIVIFDEKSPISEALEGFRISLRA